MKLPRSLQTTSLSLTLLLSAGPSAALAAGEKPAKDPMMEMLMPLTGANFEEEFLKGMIQHHQSALEMSKMVPTHTQRPELLKLAAEIIAAQEKEILQMTQWLKAWSNAEPTKMPHTMRHTQMKADMMKLDAAKDTGFDNMFLEMMIEHHSGAVSMSELLKTKTTRPELLQFADKVIKDQSAQIEQMKAWQPVGFRK